MNNIIRSVRFYYQIDKIIYKYQNIIKKIIIWVINKFSIYKLFNFYAKIILDKFFYYITNNDKKLIDQKYKKITFLIAISILTIIYIYIEPTKFLKKFSSKIKYNTI